MIPYILGVLTGVILAAPAVLTLVRALQQTRTLEIELELDEGDTYDGLCDEYAEAVAERDAIPEWDVERLAASDAALDRLRERFAEMERGWVQ